MKQPKLRKGTNMPSLRVALTFDDGPATGGSQNPTRRVLQALDSRGIRAAFFIQGHAKDSGNNYFRGNTEVGREIIADMHADGHIIGIHTGMDGKDAHHKKNNHIKRLAAGELYNDCVRCQNLIEEETGDYGGVEFVRAPFGDTTDAVIDKYSDLSLQHVRWDIDPERGAGGSLSKIKANIASQMETYLGGTEKQQMVVLFHDVQSVIAYNLVELIDEIDDVATAEGYTADFHLSKSEMEMTLRAQSDEN